MHSKSIELVNYLIDSGANLELQNEQGLTALHVACQIGWIEGVKKLIDSKAKMIPDKSGNLPTHIAAQQNNRDIIILFVNYKRNNILVGSDEGISYRMWIGMWKIMLGTL